MELFRALLPLIRKFCYIEIKQVTVNGIVSDEINLSKDEYNMYKVYLKLGSIKCGAVLNGYREEDILTHINDVDITNYDSDFEIRQALDNTIENTGDFIEVVVDRGGQPFSRKVKSKNHGFAYNIVDTAQLKKLEVQAKQEAEKVSKFKKNNLNKTVIVSSASLKQFYIFQFTPYDPKIIETPKQISKEKSNSLVELLLAQSDIEFEVLFDMISNTQAKNAVKLANNKMIASGYINLSTPEKNEPLHTEEASEKKIFRKYKISNKTFFGDVFFQLLIWLVLIIITFGAALPFFSYYFFKLLISNTEIEEVEYQTDN
jgi:hypothetical protein